MPSKPKCAGFFPDLLSNAAGWPEAPPPGSGRGVLTRVKTPCPGPCYTHDFPEGEVCVITLEDILDMTCLTRAEIEAVAEHEHLCPLDAALLAEWETHQPKGWQHLQRMICEDIRATLHRGDLDHARALYAVLRHFIAEHPEAARGAS